jgi:uncharacterized repeat protein (TIGR04052 family)
MLRILIASGLLALFTLSPVTAQDDAEPMTIQFAARVGEEDVTCEASYTGVGAGETDIRVADFRFYVSNVRLLTGDGDEVPLALEQDGLWQYENVALLDFEDGSEHCGEAGNAALNDTIYGSVPPGAYTGVAFELGVPFELNHQDVTTAPSPLNLGAMFWNWQGGYKFFRADLLTEDTELPGYFIHLGSTGCQSPAAMVAPEEACARPNRLEVRLDDFDAASDVIVADIAALLQGVDLDDNTPEPPGCMSMPMDPDCLDVLRGFGIDIESGQCIDDDCSQQTLFYVQTDAKTEPSTSNPAGMQGDD